MASFDFKPYLHSIDPASSYEIVKLSGGLVNLMVRASKTTASDSGTFPGTRSLILKYASRFVAMVGSEAPFSQARQEVEVGVLKLFHDEGPLHALREQACIRIPKVLHHDVGSSVLIIEDLGSLVALWDLLSPRALEWDHLANDDTAEIGLSLGKRIGGFFARLHSAETVQRVKDASRSSVDIGTAVQHLSGRVTKDLVFKAAVKPIRQRLTTRDSKELYQRIVKEFNRESIPEEGCFGDCHPGAILLPDWELLAKEQSGSNASAPELTVSVIDWEFAEISGRGVNGDMAQFLASLHCH